MGRTDAEQHDLRAQLEAVKKQVIIGARYRHYKSAAKVYEVSGLGFLEATDEICVIYRACYGEQLTFIRPLRVWLEHVEWQGARVARFSRL